MSMIKVDFESCKACGLCVQVCPFKLLGLGSKANSKGYYAVEQHHPEKCSACKLCSTMCPDSAITVVREK